MKHILEYKPTYIINTEKTSENIVKSLELNKPKEKIQHNIEIVEKFSVSEVIEKGKVSPYIINLCKKAKAPLLLNLLQFLSKKPNEELSDLIGLTEFSNIAAAKLKLYNVKGQQLVLPYNTSYVTSDSELSTKYFISNLDKKPYAITHQHLEEDEELYYAIQDYDFNTYFDLFFNASTWSQTSVLFVYHESLKNPNQYVEEEGLKDFFTKLQNKKFMKYGKSEFDWFE